MDVQTYCLLMNTDRRSDPRLGMVTSDCAVRGQRTFVAGDFKTLANGPGDPFYVCARARSYLEAALIVCYHRLGGLR
jgi:hypothetical protein